MPSDRLLQTDYLVLGSGIAGLSFALRAAEHGRVLIVSKRDLSDSNTAWAQGGIAGVFDEHDTIQSHYEDTLTAGAGLVDEPVAKLVVREGPRLIEELFSWGMKPDRDAKGKLQLGREGGHAHHRIIHSNGDATGAEVQREIGHCISSQQIASNNWLHDRSNGSGLQPVFSGDAV